MSRLLHRLRAILSPAPPETVVPAGYRIDRGLAYFRRNLKNVHAVASASGFAVVFLTMPVCDAETVYRKVEKDGRRQFSAPLPEDFARFSGRLRCV